MSSNSPANEPKRPRHLMDPNAPVRAASNQSVTGVQRWVMTSLVMTVSFLLAGGWVVIAAEIVTKQSGQIILLVNSAAFGVAGVAAGLVIHQKSPLSPWLLLGFIPAVIGAFVVL
jgi:hypothetical protein